MNIIETLFTRNNITLFLSIFGSVGTLITFISSYLTKRKNLKIKLVSCTYRKDLGWLVFVIAFENHSHLPIAITAISAVLNNQTIKAMPHPHPVGDFVYRNGNNILDTKVEYNLKLPADIQQLSALSGYVLFELLPEEIENLSTPVTLAVRSTRGREQKIELSPDLIKWN